MAMCKHTHAKRQWQTSVQPSVGGRSSNARVRKSAEIHRIIRSREREFSLYVCVCVCVCKWTIYCGACARCLLVCSRCTRINVSPVNFGGFAPVDVDNATTNNVRVICGHFGAAIVSECVERVAVEGGSGHQRVGGDTAVRTKCDMRWGGFRVCE